MDNKKTFDELVSMLDRVFRWLADNSHTDPSFPKIKEAFSELDEGEIDDCLKKLYNDGHLYFQDNKKEPIVPDVLGMPYTRGLNYLVSFDGKLFLRMEGSYKSFLNRLATEKAAKEVNETRLVRWTKNLTWATLIAASLIVLWEIIKTFCVEHH